MDPAASPTSARAPPGRWIGMWIRPRPTIRRILDGGSRRGVLALAAALGVSQALDQLANHDAGARQGLPAILAVGVGAGMMLGPAALFLLAWLVRWTGSWLHGVATAADVRAALAWGQVPTVTAAPLWIPVLLAGGREVFRAQPELDGPAGLTVLACGLAMAAAALWGAVTTVLAVAEAHRFSAWRALGSTALAALLLVAPLGAAGLVVAWLAGR